MKFVNIGFGNLVAADRIVTVVSPESAPIKRLVVDAKQAGSLIDATYGHKTQSVIVTDSDHVILTFLSVGSMLNRLGGEKENATELHSDPIAQTEDFNV